MQKWLSIYNNFNILVINFMSSFYFPDPELHILPAYPPTHHVAGPCHHGMARPQVADRGTASDKEGSCE